MVDIESMARDIVARSRRQAELLLAEAQAEAEKLKAKGFGDGLAEGNAAGAAEGLEQGRKAGEQKALEENRVQLQQAFAAISQAAVALNATRADLESAALQEVVKLSIAIAARITKRQGLIEPQALAANLEEAIKLVVQQSDLRIAIHPAQRQTLDQTLPKLSLKFPSLKHVEIVEDAEIAPGGCRISTRQGIVDADLGVQLDRIVHDLLPLPQEQSA